MIVKKLSSLLFVLVIAACLTSCNGPGEGYALNNKTQNDLRLPKRNPENAVVYLPPISKDPEENKLNAEKCVSIGIDLTDRGVINGGTNPAYYRSAKIWLDRSIALLPNATAYAGMGRLYCLLGNKQKSIAYYEKSFKLAPAQFSNYVTYGNSLVQFEMYTQAIQAYSKFLEKIQKQTNVWMLRGIAYYKNKQYQDASSDLLRACKEMPNSPEPRLYLGLTQRAMGRRFEAIGTLLEAEVLYQKMRPEISSRPKMIHKKIQEELMKF